MNMPQDMDHAACLSRIAALIADKRRARVQLTLGVIDADVAEARVQSADAELARQWQTFRTSQVRPASAQTPSG
jgi:hypothetical protein